ncbi:hypothetical protein IWX75_001755 [Arthrobacter sp. CAN_A6]|uniref:CBM96 family carbohydrate-binding protein n=1 Tax=Arthrobacter sp. CAN_A6 TaxID=2787721 RepID=UPI0018CA4D78
MAAAGAVAVVAALTTVPAAQAGPSLTNVADSYTVSSLPEANRGTSPKIAVGRDGKDEKTGYLTFADSRPGSASTALGLTLTFTGGTSGEISVRSVGPEWSETDITAGNAPAAGRIVGTAAVVEGKQTITIPLSGVRSENGTISLALSRDDEGISRIASRENSATSGPELAPLGGSGAPPVSTPPVSTPPASPAPSPTSPSGTCEVSVILVPSCGAWFGASANPLAGESWDAALGNFEAQAGRTMDIAHYYKRGQSAMFPNAVELNRQDEPGKNRILFYNWKPTGLTWRQVADGAADDYLIDLAEHMKTTADEPFFLSLNAEMEDEVNPQPGSGQTADDYREFARHTVQVLRSNGVGNAVVVMNYIGIQKWGETSWFEDLYPGDDVVDWIAQDPYAFGAPPVWLTDFDGLANRTTGGAWPGFYNWAAENHPNKPQMFAEWGVDEKPEYPNHKTDFFRTAEEQLKNHPKIKALVYWNSSGIAADGSPRFVGKTRIDSAPGTLEAFRDFVQIDELTAPRAYYLDR